MGEGVVGGLRDLREEAQVGVAAEAVLPEGSLAPDEVQAALGGDGPLGVEGTIEGEGEAGVIVVDEAGAEEEGGEEAEEADEVEGEVAGRVVMWTGFRRELRSTSVIDLLKVGALRGTLSRKTRFTPRMWAREYSCCT